MYTIVFGEGSSKKDAIKNLSEEVGKLIKEGWTTYEFPFLEKREGANFLQTNYCFYQAMIKADAN